MSYSRQDYVADQLRAAAPDAEWNAAGVARDRELAAILIRAGIIDLARLAILPVQVEFREFGWSTPIYRTSYALQYDGKNFGFLGTPDFAENRATLEDTATGPRVAWSAVGHGNVGYDIVPAGGGFAIIPLWASSSDADKIRKNLIFIGTLLVSFVLPAAAFAAVKQAIEAAYPGITAAIGNLALSIAFTGGDIEKSLTLALAGYVGAQVGQGVFQATDAKSLAAVTANVTRSFIAGGDIDKALKSSLLTQGANIVDDLFSFLDPVAPADGFTWDGSFGGSLPVVSTDLLDPGSTLNWGDPQFTFSDPSAWGGIGIDWFAPSYDFSQPGFLWPSSGGDPAAVAQVTAPSSASSSDWSFKSILANTSALANTALQLQATFLKLKNGLQVNTTAQSTNADGSITRTTSDGRTATRDASGRVTYSLPPVGVAQATIDGNFVTNNGDGTYTIVTQSGQRITKSYGSAANAGTMNTGTLLALGVGAFLLLRK